MCLIKPALNKPFLRLLSKLCIGGLILGINPVYAKPNLQQLDHIIVIYLENHSFDNLFGLFPGANGIAQAKQGSQQVDSFGWSYQNLPAVMNGKQVDSRFPVDLPNQPFKIDDYIAQNINHTDLTHRFFIHQMQINASRNDKFAQLSSAGGLALGYYDLHNTALWQYAKEYTLADNFYQAAFGGSFLNHQWLICACTPKFDNAPAELRQWKIDASTGRPVSDPSVSADGYAVGTIQPFYPPYDPAHSENRLPPQYQTTIGDRLSAKNISWAWYAGGWRDALANVDKGAEFQYHHQPFSYYANYAPDSQARREHLKDAEEFFSDLSANFPQVAFFKPVGAQNQHPGYSNITAGDEQVKQLVEAVRHSAIWSHTAIIVTYDEYGGYWDHVAPPKVDRWGPGSRVPAIIISPYAKKAHVDHTQYDTTAILKLIEMRFDLEPLTDRDENAQPLTGAFEFGGR